MRSQLGLLRRGRPQSNGQGGDAPTFRAPPPPADLANLVSYNPFALNAGSVTVNWGELHPRSWFEDAAVFYGVGLGVATQVEVRTAALAPVEVFGVSELLNQWNPQQNRANQRINNPPALTADMQMRTKILFCKQIPGQVGVPGAVVATWAISPWVTVGTVATAEPDEDEELGERLAMITTHAALDAWVQAHEANLPCRPDDWANHNLVSKRNWVVNHYTPDTAPAEDADAFDDDRDE
jgi:hypothetical protein